MLTRSALPQHLVAPVVHDGSILLADALDEICHELPGETVWENGGRRGHWQTRFWVTSFQ